MDPRKRMKSVEQFRKYCPKMEENFQKPAASGRKPHVRKRVRKPQAEIILDQMEKLEKVKILRPKHSSEGRLRTASWIMVPRKFERYQGNCGVKLEASDEANNNYLVVKSFETSTFLVKGESHSKYGPQYVHFQRHYLKEYAHREHDLSYDDIPFTEIKVDQKTLQALSNDDKSNMKEYRLNIDV